MVKFPAVSVVLQPRNDTNWAVCGSLQPQNSTCLLWILQLEVSLNLLSPNPNAIDPIELPCGTASVIYSTSLSPKLAGSHYSFAETVNFIPKDKTEWGKTVPVSAYEYYDTPTRRFSHQDKIEWFNHFIG